MVNVRRIDLREQTPVPGLGDVTDPGIVSLQWVCQPCRWGEHENCQYPAKLCYCVECYGEEEQDE